MLLSSPCLNEVLVGVAVCFDEVHTDSLSVRSSAEKSLSMSAFVIFPALART